MKGFWPVHFRIPPTSLKDLIKLLWIRFIFGRSLFRVEKDFRVIWNEELWSFGRLLLIVEKCVFVTGLRQGIFQFSACCHFLLTTTSLEKEAICCHLNQFYDPYPEKQKCSEILETWNVSSECHTWDVCSSPSWKSVLNWDAGEGSRNTETQKENYKVLWAQGSEPTTGCCSPELPRPSWPCEISW